LGDVGERARSLRRQMSSPEILLWRALQRRPSGLKFRRQHPSGYYVADFYCHKARLIIEIDGSAHDFGDRPARDTARDAWFASREIAVLRIAASAVMRDTDAVVDYIVETAVRRVAAQE